MLAAIILAGGESSRMGSPKALLPYRLKTFVEQLIEVTRHPEVGLTRVVLGANAEEITTKAKLDPSIVVINSDWQKGQLSSIHAGLRSLPAGLTDGVLLCLVDHPLISQELVGELIEKFYSSGKLIVLPTCKGKRGHPAVISSKLYDELLAAPVEVGARAVVWAHAADLLEVPTEDEGVILNLNDPATLEKAFETDF